MTSTGLTRAKEWPAPTGKDLEVWVGTEKLDGVQAITIHCAGPKDPVRAVLVVNNVSIDVDGVEIGQACDAALRLLEKTQ